MWSSWGGVEGPGHGAAVEGVGLLDLEAGLDDLEGGHHHHPLEPWGWGGEGGGPWGWRRKWSLSDLLCKEGMMPPLKVLGPRVQDGEETGAPPGTENDWACASLPPGKLSLGRAWTFDRGGGWKLRPVGI